MGGGRGVRFVARRVRREKEQGVARRERLSIVVKWTRAEKAFAVHKLATERINHFPPHRVATGPNRGSEDRHHAARIRAKLLPHPSRSFFDDTLQSAAPPSVDRRDSAPKRVHQQDRQAICDPHGEQNARLIGHQGITGRHGARCRRRCIQSARPVEESAARGPLHPIDDGRVNLAQSSRPEAFGSDRHEELKAISFDASAPVGGNETEVQSRRGRLAEASVPRAEGM